MADKLSNAPDIVKAYHQSHPTAPQPHKTMNLWYSAEIPDSPCSCLICL